MTARLVLWMFALLSLVQPVVADEAYVVMFSGAGTTVGCHRAVWGSDAVFYNPTTSPATVRLLDISNGDVAPGTPTTRVIPPNQAISVVFAPPSPGVSEIEYKFWVMHLDVPAGVIIDSRYSVVDENFCLAEHFFGPPIMKVSLPVFRSLVPADIPQLKVGTDAGTAPARQNVAIYNAGNETATATIEVRRTCNGSVVDMRTVSVPPNTIAQFGGFATGSNDCGTSDQVGNFMRYTVVTVNQPSFSLVTSITDHLSSVQGLAPVSEFGVNTQF